MFEIDDDCFQIAVTLCEYYNALFIIRKNSAKCESTFSNDFNNNNDDK